MPTDPLFYLVGLTAVFTIGFGKGAFGGGLAIIGIPFLALVTSPVDAAIIIAIVASATDIFAVQAFPMRTWSWPDLVWLGPAMIVGLALGTLFFVLVDPRILVLGIALVTLGLLALVVWGSSVLAAKQIPRRWVITLGILRAVAVILFALCLLQPALSYIHGVPQPPELLVLIDTSASMNRFCQPSRSMRSSPSVST